MPIAGRDRLTRPAPFLIPQCSTTKSKEDSFLRRVKDFPAGNLYRIAAKRFRSLRQLCRARDILAFGPSYASPKAAALLDTARIGNPSPCNLSLAPPAQYAEPAHSVEKTHEDDCRSRCRARCRRYGYGSGFRCPPSEDPGRLREGSHEVGCDRQEVHEIRSFSLSLCDLPDTDARLNARRPV